MNSKELSPLFVGAIRDVEDRIEQTLNQLRTLTPQSPPAEALRLALAVKAAFSPIGFSTRVQLEEQGRKKRSTADADNFRFATGEIVVMFEPDTTTEPTGSILVQPENPLFASKVLSPQPPPDNRTQLEIEQLCEALRQTAQDLNSFVSVKRFRDETLPAYPYPWCKEPGGPQRVLNASLAAGRVVVSKIPNPKKPSFPTACLTLSPAALNNGKPVSRFNPIPMMGEPASVTLLNDRG